MLRKIFFFLISFFVFLPFFPNKEQANAAEKFECQVRVDSVVNSEGKRNPEPATSDDSQIAVIIDPNGNVMNEATVTIDGEAQIKGIVREHAGDFGAFIFRPGRTITINGREHVVMDDQGVITIPTLNILRLMDGSEPPGDNKNWPVSDDYRVTVYGPGDTEKSPSCEVYFSISAGKNHGGGSGGNYCQIILDTPNNTYKNGEKVKFNVAFNAQDASTEPDHQHRVKMKQGAAGFLYERMNEKYKTSELTPGTVPRDDRGLTTGGYYLEVFRDASEFGFFWENEGPFCQSKRFYIKPDGGSECEDNNVEECGFKSNRPLALPCDAKGPGYDDNIGCTKIRTAIGYVDTQANEFVRWVLGFVLGISGGIVLIIIIVSGYRLMTSQGDPEKVKNARDQLTAAIVGLLFIIFSLVILQLITRDILQIPGFGS